MHLQNVLQFMTQKVRELVPEVLALEALVALVAACCRDSLQEALETRLD